MPVVSLHHSMSHNFTGLFRSSIHSDSNSYQQLSYSYCSSITTNSTRGGLHSFSASLPTTGSCGPHSYFQSGVSRSGPDFPQTSITQPIPEPILSSSPPSHANESRYQFLAGPVICDFCKSRFQICLLRSSFSLCGASSLHNRRLRSHLIGHTVLSRTWNLMLTFSTPMVLINAAHAEPWSVRGGSTWPESMALFRSRMAMQHHKCIFSIQIYEGCSKFFHAETNIFSKKIAFAKL